MSNQSNYSSLNDAAKAAMLDKLHNKEGLSLRKMADIVKISFSSVKRECSRLGVPVRNKSQAQKNALEQGAEHPTKGKKRSDDTKEKIAKGMYNAWENEIDREGRSKKSKEAWDNLSSHKKKEIKHKAAKAIREASQTGSKLEKYFLLNLPKYGYRVSFHKERMLGNTKLQVDLMIDDMAIAIEINGLSHYQPIWGDKSFARTVKADHNKKALLFQYGFKLINVKNTKSDSPIRFKMLLEDLLHLLDGIKQGNELFKNKSEFEIGD